MQNLQLPMSPHLAPGRARLRFGAAAVLLLGLLAAPAAAADADAESRETLTPFKVDTIIGTRAQIIHTAGLGATYQRAWEQYLGLNLTGNISADSFFNLSLNLIRPNDEDANHFMMGRRMLDNLLLTVRYQSWTAGMGFLWADLSPLTFETSISKRPLLFDRDPEAGEEAPQDYYQRLFTDGFFKEETLNAEQYFSGGRGTYYWVKKPVMGVHIQNDSLPGNTYFKLYSGKSEGYFSKQHYYNEHAGRLGVHAEDNGLFTKTKFEINAYNRSNDRGDIAGNTPGAVELFNNTVAAPLLQVNVQDFDQIEAEFSRSYLQNSSLALEDSAWRIENTLFLHKLTGSADRQVVILHYSQINPDFVGKGSSVLENIHLNGAQKEYISNQGDIFLLYNNQKRWMVDAKLSLAASLLRLIYGGSQQIQETTNEVASTHFLDGINYNGGIWWNVFWTNLGLETNPAAQAYGENALGNRRIATDWWRGNTETIFLNETGNSRKYTSFLAADYRQPITDGLWFQVYAELASLYGQVAGSPFYQQAALFHQSYAQAVGVCRLAEPLFFIAEYGLEKWLSGHTDPGLDYFDDSVGAGLDYALDKRTAIYLHGKYHRHIDRVIADNCFTAEQWWLELKSYF